MTEGRDNWPSIYAWTGDGYTNVSSKYPTYYRNWLASTKKELASLEAERRSLVQPASASSAQNESAVEKNGSGIVTHFFTEQPEGAPTIAPEVEGDWHLEIDAKEAQVTKIERFLGTKDAGMPDAIRWANSADPEKRTLAAQVFEEMGTSEALRYEQTLSGDSDPKVAKLASRELRNWGNDNPYDAPAFVRVTPDHPRAF
jgi:hypothetical protein